MRIQNTNSGFTLLELMVGVTILGILAVIGVASFSGTFGRARDSKALTDVKAISQALELYYSLNNEYPDELNDLVAGDEAGRFIKGGVVPTDKATGEDYLYAKSSSVGFCVCSLEFEHESGAGGNAIVTRKSRDFSCGEVNTKLKDSDKPTHFCVFAAQ
jgi:prepilin-type N-terminal cleavage/methylation domain-containing protein